MSYTGDTHIERLAERQRQNDAAAVLSHEPSMRFIARFLGEVGHGTSAFAGNSNATFYALGRQDAGSKILDMLRAADDRAHLRVLTISANERERLAAEQAKINGETHDED